MDLKSKKVLLAGWGAENPQDTYMYQIYYLMLKRIFPDMETFDTKKNYFQLGKEKMNSGFLNLIKEKNYDLILFAFENDEFSTETLEKMREVSSNSRFVVIICDDDARFDSWSRYIASFFDYVITSQDFLKEYKKENITAFFHLDYNTNDLNPMNIEKIYDVTFIGRPKADRNEVIKYLLDSGIKVTLFGWDWYKYPEFKDVYKGPLNQQEYAKVINQSKINLSPAKAGYAEQRTQFNMKGRYFEVALCKSFQLIEKFPTLLKFFSEDEIGMYDSQEDMLEKIKYYLKNDKEREKIAERAYEKTIKDYNREKQLIDIFTEVFKRKIKRKTFDIRKKITVLTKKDMKEMENIKEKIKDSDYIAFDISARIAKLRNYFLSIALELTGKPVVCCDYYVSSLGLKDYMVFLSKFSFKRIGDEAKKLIDINSLMVKKDFFLENLSEFEKIISEKDSELMNEKNIAFVSIPLVSVNKIKKIKYEKMIKAFEFRFPNELFSLMYQKKMFTNSYPYFLIFKSLKGNFFIMKYLLSMLKDKSNQDKLLVNKAYIENSPLEKLKKK